MIPKNKTFMEKTIKDISNNVKKCGKSIMKCCKNTYKKMHFELTKTRFHNKNKYRNRSIMINPKGKIIAYYDKIKMFDVKLPNKEQHKESKTYRPGKKLVSVNLPWGKLGNEYGGTR